jgi:translation initiation factor IF-1
LLKSFALMYKKNNNNNQNKDSKIELKGTVIKDLQDSNYLIEIDLGDGLKHELSAYPSGKMRTHYRGRVLVGDSVTVEIDVPYIDKGRITRKIIKRHFNNR